MCEMNSVDDAKERAYRYFLIIKEHWLEVRRRHEEKVAKLPETETEALENIKARFHGDYMRMTGELMLQIRSMWILEGIRPHLEVFNYEKKEEE